MDFSGHAVQRMFQRAISRDAVLLVVASGEVIADYPGDTPYPSKMLFGLWNGRPVHVVVAFDRRSSVCIIVTAYEPLADQWEIGSRKRKVL